MSNEEKIMVNKIQLSFDIEKLKTYSSLIKCAPMPNCKTIDGKEIASMANIKAYEAFRYLRENIEELSKQL